MKSSSEPIAILMPCRAQPRRFFDDSVGSVLAQSADTWNLLILIDHDSPAELSTWTQAFQDPRIALVIGNGGLAAALNRGMAEARTAWVSILLADDRYDPTAIATLHQAIRRHPKVDVFHSARRQIDELGRRRGPVHPSRRVIDPETFRTLGSPVKHLMCWRRERGLASAVKGLRDLVTDENGALFRLEDADGLTRLLQRATTDPFFLADRRRNLARLSPEGVDVASLVDRHLSIITGSAG